MKPKYIDLVVVMSILVIVLLTNFYLEQKPKLEYAKEAPVTYIIKGKDTLMVKVNVRIDTTYIKVRL